MPKVENKNNPGVVTTQVMAEVRRLIGGYSIAKKTPETREAWKKRAWALGATYDDTCGENVEWQIAEMLTDLKALSKQIGA